MAELAGAVGDGERADDEVAPLNGGHLRAGVLHDADELVTHPGRITGRRHRAVRPQVAAADAGGGDADERVGGLLEHGVGNVLDSDVAGAVHGGRSHEVDLRSGVGQEAGSAEGRRRITAMMIVGTSVRAATNAPTMTGPVAPSVEASARPAAHEPAAVPKLNAETVRADASVGARPA